MMRITVQGKHVGLPEPDCAVLSFLCVYFSLFSLTVSHTQAHLLQISLIVSLDSVDSQSLICGFKGFRYRNRSVIRCRGQIQSKKPWVRIVTKLKNSKRLESC